MSRNVVWDVYEPGEGQPTIVELDGLYRAALAEVLTPADPSVFSRLKAARERRSTWWGNQHKLATAIDRLLGHCLREDDSLYSEG